MGLTAVDAPTVSLNANDANASEEGPDRGTFRVSRSGGTTGL